ncbi:LysR family transcriptional regulator [Caulobacter rhizosphaerae]|uniref:LysR family transcriptional regulator n=1 Tax=Caulobacter rhizosphaerae TaxID=2010972 RepID=UPI00286C45D1|nr:LysR family transcriptional regulator [Caulobacter rhizosphaerae]
MELDWLEDFLALVEHQHFGRAAEARNVSQPAFSRRVRLLEAWLGAPLFNRDTHRVALTTAGEQWKPTAEDLLRRLYLGREQTRAVSEGYVSTLRFASTHALSITFFPQWLEEIEAEEPLASSVSLVTDNMAGCERMMQQGQAQFLLCHHHPSTPVSFRPNYFTSIDIGRDVLVPVSAPDPEAPGTARFALPGSLDAPVPYLAFGEVSGMGRILASTHALEGPSMWLAPGFTAHVATVLAAMARAGRGLAWLPLSLIARDLDDGGLVRAGDGRWDVPIDIRLYRPRARQTAAAEAFWARLKVRAEAAGSPG